MVLERHGHDVDGGDEDHEAVEPRRHLGCAIQGGIREFNTITYTLALRAEIRVLFVF